MREEISNMMAIIPQELHVDVYQRLKAVIQSIIRDIVLDIEKIEYDNSTKTSMDKVLVMNRIIEICCAEHGIKTSMMWSTKRNSEYVRLRQILMWAFRIQYPQIALRIIGELFHRDHATILHAIRQVEGSISTDPVYRELVNNTLMIIHRNDFDMSLVVHRFERIKSKALVK